MAGGNESPKKRASSKTKAAFAAASLAEFVTETQSITADLEFLIHSSGERLDNLELTIESLNRLEAFYRACGRRKINIDVEELERLMAIMLGATVVSLYSGQWALYQGKYYVLSPFVVQLSSGKFVDVFLFCKSLSQKTGLNGAASGNALAYFVDHVEKFSFA